MDEENLINPELINEEENRLENSLRPKTLSEYIGQTKVKENMKVYIEAAKKRGEPLDHVLLYGPPGLGKTTLSNIISNEMNSNIKITSGPAIEKPGDLAALLTNLSEFDVIINTVPHLILTEEKIQYVRDDCLLVDLASNPGGIDKKATKDKKLKLLWALALPGKVAPVTTAEFIKDTVYNILKEIYKK